MASPLADLIRPAVDAARAALRDLDADQVPADLKRVVGHSGALTPPLSVSLLRGLDRYDWLRARALDGLAESGESPPGTDSELSVVFLERPPGWVERIANAVAQRAREGSSELEESREERISTLEASRADVKRRLKEERFAWAEERAELAARLEQERSARRAVKAAEGRSESAAMKRAADAGRQAADAEDRVRGLGKVVASLQEAALHERRLRVAAEHALAEAGADGGWVSRDPAELAARLDDVAAMARPPVAVAGTSAPGGMPEILGLPAGVAPDQAEAMTWVLGRSSSTTVIIDGYNAGFALAGVGDPARARRRLMVEAERLPTLASGMLSVVVVYDSSVAGSEAVAARRVTVCFTVPGRTADEDIVEMAGRASGPVVVVSDDREVREEAERSGALALWSAALVAWAKRR